ncbi:ATP-binding protein [Cutibacterium acnes]|uniref:ATP-binding protein n=1 Tax=Cutibacterium acnes TaxID=1747 RepID=UPI001C114D44|nr:ATP-binding protein [Cutibacterium acnes]MBU5180231.1 ATP-binding protein [Cutibacterium acnes]
MWRTYPRILIHPKPLIILDEATSAMDSISEERSMAVIQQVASDSILIIVSHKLKTLATADEIIVLESGQLTERGPLAELVNDDGVFNRLWERQ